MSTSTRVSVTAQRAWGIGAVVVEIICLVPSIITMVLMLAVDENYGWLMLVMIPVVVAGGLLGMLAGIVGMVFAGIRRRAFAWPVVGTVLGVALVAVVSLIIMPSTF